MSVWRNDGSNVSTLEKKILKIYHVLENLDYGLLRIYTDFWRKIHKNVLVGCQKNSVHQKKPYITRLRHLENHTEAVELYTMNWHLNRLTVEWVSVVSLSVIPWMIDCHVWWKWVNYRNPNASKEWLDPRQPAKVIIKINRLYSKVTLCAWWNFELRFTGNLFQTDM